jgi:hypothetical protein
MSKKLYNGQTAFGGPLKALDETGKLGGYVIIFSDGTKKDKSGEYFTPQTKLNNGKIIDGDGVECLYHHGLKFADIDPPLKDTKGVPIEEHEFPAWKTKRDDIGIWAEINMRMNDRYEAAMYHEAKAGRIGTSTGVPNHRIKKDKETGEIQRWPIAEISLTPTPCEPMLNGGVRPIKSLTKEQFPGWDGVIKAIVDAHTPKPEATKEAMSINSETAGGSFIAPPVGAVDFYKSAHQILSTLLVHCDEMGAGFVEGTDDHTMSTGLKGIALQSIGLIEETYAKQFPDQPQLEISYEEVDDLPVKSE